LKKVATEAVEGFEAEMSVSRLKGVLRMRETPCETRAFSSRQSQRKENLANKIKNII
jgi:hypothetical protein